MTKKHKHTELKKVSMQESTLTSGAEVGAGMTRPGIPSTTTHWENHWATQHWKLTESGGGTSSLGQ